MPRRPGQASRRAGRLAARVELWPWVDSHPMCLPRPTDLATVTAGLVDVPLPGSGRTADRFATLAEVAAVDLSLGRLFEGHADAVAILAEAGRRSDGGIWGVWAAEPASVHAGTVGERWRLLGRKPWCSGASQLTRSLCSAATDRGPRLFVVDLADPGVKPVAGSWPAVGMAGSETLDVDLDVTVASDAAIGPPGWYTDRPGFWFGSVGVAACWLGGAIGAVRALADRLRQRGGDEHQLAHLGAAAARCTTLALAVEGAARWIDTAPVDASAARSLALQIRHAAEETCLAVLTDVGRGGGADHVSHDRAQSLRIADLAVYIRQHHAGRDAAAVGRAMLAGN